jgi:predicted nucleic acid-binding protein
MITPTQHGLVLDTSVLVNFLAIDRCALLASHPEFRFTIAGHVAQEVTYPQDAARLATAIQDDHLTTLSAGDHAELAAFAQLTATLGIGESAAIAAAVHRNLHVALEDRVARRHAESLVGRNKVLTTQQLMVGLIQATVLSVAEADAIKLDWETNHRFALPGFQSFGDLLKS